MHNFFQETPKKDDQPTNRFGMNNSQPFQNTGQLQQNSSIVPFQSGQNNSIVGQNQPGMFGSNQISPPTLNTFGTSTFSPFSSSTQNTFGSTPKFGTSSLPFNNPATPSFNTSTSMFPGTSSSSFIGGSNTGFNSNLSGSTQAPSAFGNPSSFGGPTPTSSFGGSSAFRPQAQTSFGANPSNTSSFGNTGLFGQSNSSFSNPTSSFGATQQSPFGSTQAASNSWSAPALPGWGIKDKGSKGTPYSSTRIMDDNNVFVELNDITGMKDYSNKSVDEIRKEDYEMSLCPPKQASTSLIGSAPTSVGGFSGFSNPNTTTSGIGLPYSSLQSPFGSNLAKPMSSMGSFSSNVGGLSNLPTQQPPSNTFSFGSIQPTTIGSSNTVPSFGQVAPGTNASTFGQQTSNTPFGINNTVSPFGQAAPTSTFGSGNSTIQPVSNNLFGSSNNLTQPTQPITTPSQGLGTSSSLFNTNTSFNQPTGLSSFAQNTGTQNTSLFPGVSQPSSTNLFAPKQDTNSTTISPFNTNATSQFKPTSLFGSGITPQPTAFSQPNFTSTTPINTFQSSTNIQPNNSDPYLLKNIKFDKFEQQKPSVRIPLPSPIFKTKHEIPAIDLKIRPPRPVSKNSIYTIPDIREMNSLHSISNLVIGFEGKGRIEYLEPVTLTTSEDIEKRVSFRNGSVEVNDAIGTGFNKKARVYVEGLYPMCRTTNEIIKGKADSFPQKGIQERFIYQLKNDPSKKFVDYNSDTGIYVYEVNHF